MAPKTTFRPSDEREAGRYWRMPYEWPASAQYALGVGAVALSLLVRWSLADELGAGGIPFSLTLGVLLPLVLVIRPGPFLAAAAVGWAGTLYLLVPPSMSFIGEWSRESLMVTLYTVVLLFAVAAAWLSRRVSDRRERDRLALRDSETRLRLVTDAVPALISYADAQQRYQFNNSTYEEWFGLPRNEMRSRHMREVLGEEAYQLVRPKVEAALAGRTVDFETRMPYKEGGSRFVHAHYVPDVAEDGSVAGFYVLVHDVTKLKQVEQALSESDRRKDEFLATLAHELRNPLAAIRMALGVLARAEEDPARVREMSAIIDRQSALLVRLIEDLLDVSRIKRGQVELRRAPVDIGSVIEHAVEAFSAVCSAKGVRLSVTRPDQPLAIEADAVRFTQVVGNLLSNACKFTDPGGEVAVSAAREGDEVVVRVRDTGIGMTDEELPHIFDMFTRKLDAPGREIGLGIGLALAKSIVTMHDGTIDAHSEGPGRGTELVVRVPALAGSAAGAGAPAADDGAEQRIARAPAPASTLAEPVTGAAPRGGAGRRVLAVDDNQDALAAVRHVLSMAGYSVETAECGEEAVEKGARHRPEILLLDIGLPGMDGYELARRIRGEPWGRGALLVAMTGWGQERDKHRAREAGFDAHLTKPVDADELVRLLETRHGTPALTG